MNFTEMNLEALVAAYGMEMGRYSAAIAHIRPIEEIRENCDQLWSEIQGRIRFIEDMSLNAAKARQA